MDISLRRIRSLSHESNHHTRETEKIPRVISINSLANSSLIIPQWSENSSTAKLVLHYSGTQNTLNGKLNKQLNSPNRTPLLCHHSDTIRPASYIMVREDTRGEMDLAMSNDGQPTDSYINSIPGLLRSSSSENHRSGNKGVKKEGLATGSISYPTIDIPKCKFNGEFEIFVMMNIFQTLPFFPTTPYLKDNQFPTFTQWIPSTTPPALAVLGGRGIRPRCIKHLSVRLSSIEKPRNGILSK